MTRKHNFLTIVLTLTLVTMSAGFVSAYEFPSTNENNQNIGTRPYVVQTDVGIGYVTLDFVNGYSNSLAYFEVRVDGVVITSGTPHPVVTDDFIYPGVSVDTRITGGPLTVSGTYNANEYIEIRLALGGERDWDFDWTRFDVGMPCTTIQDGVIYSSNGDLLETGFNQYGYNYQAHITNQTIEEYCLQRNDIPEGEDGHWDLEACLAYFERQPFELVMKWNDAWLSNKDCDNDGNLDRHYGFDSYIGSGAWITNHQKGTYYDDDGKKQRWSYFVKIVAAPADAYKEPGNANGSSIPGIWLNADGVEIGPVIWGSFAIIQQVESDTGTGIHGLQYLSPYSAGFGKYTPQE